MTGQKASRKYNYLVHTEESVTRVYKVLAENDVAAERMVEQGEVSTFTETNADLDTVTAVIRDD